MPENSSKRESGAKHASSAWVESSFMVESPPAPKRRRVDNESYVLAKVKSKAPTWVASEFRAQASPSKPHVRPPPPRPTDPNTIRPATKPTFQLTDPNVPLDPQPKKQISARPFSVQPIPSFLPKALKEKSAHRTQNPALSHIQTPIFQTSVRPSAAPDGFAFTAQKDVLPMPPPPRIEPNAITVAETSADFSEREYVPLTDLATPRVFENMNTISGKGKERTISSDGDISISDDPAAEDSTLATEGETEAFGMNDLSLELDRDTSHVGHSGDSGRKAKSKFVKGGLAARALMLITQREKDDALWHHYQTAKLSKNSNARADLRVHVVRILQRVGDSLLVRCALPSGESISTIGNRTIDKGMGDALFDPILVDVLFSQPGMKSLPAIEPSAVIRLWKPWIEINFDNVSRPLPISSVGEVNDKHLAITAVADDSVDHTRERSPDTPLHLDVPLHPEPPSSFSEISAHDRRAGFALLCSRFIVG